MLGFLFFLSDAAQGEAVRSGSKWQNFGYKAWGYTYREADLENEHSARTPVTRKALTSARQAEIAKPEDKLYGFISSSFARPWRTPAIIPKLGGRFRQEHGLKSSIPTMTQAVSTDCNKILRCLALKVGTARCSISTTARRCSYSPCLPGLVASISSGLMLYILS